MKACSRFMTQLLEQVGGVDPASTPESLHVIVFESIRWSEDMASPRPVFKARARIITIVQGSTEGAGARVEELFAAPPRASGGTTPP